MWTFARLRNFATFTHVFGVKKHICTGKHGFVKYEKKFSHCFARGTNLLLTFVCVLVFADVKHTSQFDSIFLGAKITKLALGHQEVQTVPFARQIVGQTNCR